MSLRKCHDFLWGVMRGNNYKYLENSIAKSRTWGNLRYIASICAMAFALVFFSAVGALGSSEQNLNPSSENPTALTQATNASYGSETNAKVIDDSTIGQEAHMQHLSEDAIRTAEKYPEAPVHITNPNVVDYFNIN